MSGFAIRAFRGAFPRTDERILEPNQATAALNCKLTSGRIDPYKGPGLVHTSDLAGTIATIYRYRFGEIFNWLVSSKVMDFARSPVAQDSLGRFYFTGDGEPRMSTYATAISGGGPYPAGWFVLGVYFPVTAPTVTPTGGVSATVETREYIYTFKTALGEESGPSPKTIISGKVDDSFNLSAMEVAPPNTGTISAAVADTPLPGQVQVTLDTVRGLSPYEEVNFAGVSGMTSLNGKFALVSVDSATNKVVVALQTAQVYAGGADTWTRVAPHNIAGMVKRIYRSVGTNTDYKFVKEIPVADTTFADNIASTVVAANGSITTLDNFPPPKNMHSVILLANGSLAGLAGNEFCMSEQGKPYSWPIAYRQSFPGMGVALVAAGNSAIILTDGYPMVATATVPENLSIAKIQGDLLAPCVAKQSVVDIGGGALYASFDGLILATTGAAQKLTDAIYTADEWVKLNPTTFKAAYQAQRYYAMHQTDSNEQDRIWVFKVNEPSTGVVEITEQVDALYSNPWDGKLYIGQGKKISEWDVDDANRYTAFWESSVWQSGRPLNLSVAQVQAKYTDIVPVNTAVQDANAALLATPKDCNGAIGAARVGRYRIAGSALRPVSDVTAGSLAFTLLQDGVPVFQRQLTRSDAFRLPAGSKSDAHQVQITTNIPVFSSNIAQGMDELKAASV